MAGVAVPKAAAAHAVATKHPSAPKAGRAKAPAVTNWLQPMNAGQVKSSATSSVKAAYSPAFNELGQQASQENGIYSKQVSDNQFYQQWVDAKSNALMANESVVNNATNSLEQQLTGNQLSDYAHQSSDLVGAANARAGNVSDNTQSTALTSTLAANQAGLKSIVGGAAQQALQVEGTQNNAANAAIANTGAFVASGQAKETSAFDTAMNTIANNKLALGEKESSAIQSEIARLQGVNITLSENNRNYNTAVQKLNISAANTASEINARAAATKLNQSKFNEAVAQNKFNDLVKNQTLSQNEQKIGISLANTNSEIALRNSEIAKNNRAGSNGLLTLNEQNTIYNEIQKAAGTMSGLEQKNGLTPQQAYQAVLNGYFIVNARTSAGKTTQKRITVPRMSNQSMLNAAFNSRAGATGLSAGDVAYLQKLGLGNISGRLPVASKNYTNVGGQQISNGALNSRT